MVQLARSSLRRGAITLVAASWLLASCEESQLQPDQDAGSVEADFLSGDLQSQNPGDGPTVDRAIIEGDAGDRVDLPAVAQDGLPRADKAPHKPDVSSKLDGPVVPSKYYGAEPTPKSGKDQYGLPIGGGAGYTKIVSQSDPRVKQVVSTKSELLSALKSAKSGEVVYVAGNASIDLSGQFDIAVPAGVTIASNRGENSAAGGRIFQTKLSKEVVEDSKWPSPFRINGEKVRITGLRLQGPDDGTSSPTRVAIKSWRRLLEVDNCEIWGWGAAAINVYETNGHESGGPDMKAGGYFHHNAIHHCQNSGLGYGVVVSNGSVCLVESNTFDYHRHAIAGGGKAGDGYEARYNIMGSHFIAGTAHNFDMHKDPGGSNGAGDLMRIHHNTFTCTQPKDSFPIFIQGIPKVGAYIDYNWFYFTSAPPVWQWKSRSGNVWVTESLIGPSGTTHQASTKVNLI